MKVALDKIPEGLREYSHFCLTKLETKPGKTKPDKVPYRADGTRASPSNPNDFTDFNTVSAIYQKGGYDGIGIGVFDDMVAIDIDHCIENGKLSEFAKSVLEKLQTYAEISISGTGIHIWARAPGLKFDRERYYFNNRKNGLEIYPAGHTKRFIATTGNALNDFDVVECTEAIQELLENKMLRPNVKNITESSVKTPGSYLSDESVISKMLSAANGHKAESLWNGDNPDGKSASEGDMALCGILAFWCGGDAKQMDRVFRQSVRMRSKRDEILGADTYGNMTIELFANREKPDYENSIKEAISAVESICSEITGIEGAQATLGKTIKKLKDAGMHIHPAMENAFTSLYGYTSDEGGIRHGSIDFVEAPSEDAKFMLITCSAFVNYLVEKWSKIK